MKKTEEERRKRKKQRGRDCLGYHCPISSALDRGQSSDKTMPRPVPASTYSAYYCCVLAFLLFFCFCSSLLLFHYAAPLLSPVTPSRALSPRGSWS